MDRALSLPLADLRVIDMADEKGEMCGRFLADLGADVIRVEPPGGARSRRAPLSFAVRNANKRGVTIDIETERERLLSLLESADVWIETTRPGTLAALGLGPDAVLARNPQLVITSITDFGQSGDYRDWQADDAIHAAMSGILSRSGLAGRDPLPAPRGMATETAAIQAAWATLVAYWNRLETGRGDHVDFSILEAATQTMDPAYGTASVSRASAFPSTRGRPEAGLYPIFPCADGHVRVVVLAPRQWRAMRAWLGEPAAFQDERFDAIPARLEAAAELHELYAALFAGLTKDAIAAEGQARGVPVAPVLGVADVLASPHFEARGAFVDAEVAPGVHGRLPSGFCEIDGARVGFRHRAPEPGEHDDDLGGAPCERPAWPAARTGEASAVPSRPLAGLRVVDFGIIVIGNEIGRLLADQGADVIKIENRAFPDAARVGYGGKLSHSFVAGSRNKRSFGVNLRTPEGVALLKRLVAGADVVLENFKPGTLEKLGLGYESLRAVEARPGDAEHQRARLDRAVEPLARLRPDRALRVGDHEPLALPRRRARIRRADHDLPGPLRRPRVRRDRPGRAHPTPPHGGRRVHRERPGRDDRQPARRRLPRRLARRLRRRAFGRLPVRRRRRVVRHHGVRTTSSGVPSAASSATRPPTWPSGPARFRRAP